ncbi:hypothetical protein [Streptomyces sp. TRM68367]|uniref:hypothetical protein n=1 Tax=Streptomyces sp. TRM68367 TaxID=2758415 RepID=UPI00165C0ACA|nr:hypothetical protein [Streptomyces sp. TRM68367]MBC9729892.1 hypothetical protein [Streptomyces sp. TRM68367]
MTGPDHYREAERLTRQAGTWMDADTGWKAHLPTSERLAHRMADLAEAQVHATLANAAATALNDNATDEGGMPLEDYDAWREVAGVARKGAAK